MKITFTRTTTYSLEVDADDDATLNAIAEVITPLLPDDARDSLADMLNYACQWDHQEALSALIAFADVDDEDMESVDWDVDDIEPDDAEDEDEDVEVALA